jgi:GNAT superfamily N-acetyltransferase
MPDSAVSFRRASIADIEALVRLRLDFLSEVNRKPSPPGLEARLYEFFGRHLPSGDFISWFAESEGEVVATSALVMIHRPPSHSNITGLYAHIINIYTVPAWRRRGIARSLFAKILDEARAAGCGKATLHATAEGRPLYESFGFQVCTSEAEMDLDLTE